MRIAFDERKNSDDPKALSVSQSGVGVVLVNAGEIVARSANKLPPALKSHHRHVDRKISEAERYHFIEHAERAAIITALQAGADLNGATIYCTRFACSDCARMIIWAGIRRAVFGAGLEGEAKWLLSQQAASDMLQMSGVKIDILRAGASPNLSAQ